MLKNWKSIPILFFALIAVASLSTSCGEDRAIDEAVSYEVDVAIISPANNAQMAAGEAFNVEVEYTRKENTIHNIKVEIVDMNGNQIQKLVERHAHVANEFTFKMEAIKIDQAGTYLVRASTTDLDSDGEEHQGEGNDDDKNNLVEHTITIK